MFTRQELQTMASWLGKIQRFNVENANKYLISFHFYNPYFDTLAQILFYKINHGSPSLITRVALGPATGIEEINCLLNLIVKHKVDYDKINNSNWKSFCEEI